MKLLCQQGRIQDLAGRGARNIFFRFGNLHVALLEGLGGIPLLLPRIFFKWYNFVRFGVYLDQILSLKKFKKHLFYIQILKITIFYIKNKYFGYTPLLWVILMKKF